MKRSRLVLILSALLMLALVAGPAAAAKKKIKKGHDPWKGRVAIGARLGGGIGEYSSFIGQLSITYWWVKYVSTTVASGYGFFTATYFDEENEEQTTTVNYIPSEFLVTLYPLPDANISPYLGPGVGADYIWYEIEPKIDEPEKHSGTIYSAIGRGGIFYRISRNARLMLGARYTQPMNSTGDLEDEEQGYLSFEAGIALMF